MPAEVVVAPVEALRDRFALLVESAARRGVADRGSFSIAIPGGSAAELLLPRLINASIDWPKAHVLWVDERAVARDAPESNYGAVRAPWLDRIPVRQDRIYPMPGDLPDLKGAADVYEATLRGVLGDTPAIDVVLLGMGPDGHVASLFPGHATLEEKTAWCVGVADAPKPPPRRLSLTLPVLAAAGRLVLFATGTAKAKAVASVLEDPASPLPAALVLRGSSGAVCLLDSDAASACARPIR